MLRSGFERVKRWPGSRKLEADSDQEIRSGSVCGEGGACRDAALGRRWMRHNRRRRRSGMQESDTPGAQQQRQEGVLHVSGTWQGVSPRVRPTFFFFFFKDN